MFPLHRLLGHPLFNDSKRGEKRTRVGTNLGNFLCWQVEPSRGFPHTVEEPKEGQWSLKG